MMFVLWMVKEKSLALIAREMRNHLLDRKEKPCGYDLHCGVVIVITLGFMRNMAYASMALCYARSQVIL